MATEKELWDCAFRLFALDGEDADTYARAMSLEAAERGDPENAALWRSVAGKIASLQGKHRRLGQ